MPLKNLKLNLKAHPPNNAMQHWLPTVRSIGLKLLKMLMVGLAMTVLMAIAPSAEARPLCRTLNQHQICILDIKRSAKNYWEYRVTLSLDGEKIPTEVYNCRDRTRTAARGTPRPFQPDGPGPLICSLLA